MKIYFKFIITFIVIHVSLFDNISFAQTSENLIDYNRIPQKKVRKVLRKLEENGIKDISEVYPKCYVSEDSSKYCVQTDSHIIKENIAKVWNKMLMLNLWDEFNGKLVSMALLYSKKLNRVFYKDDKYLGIEEGQIFYLNLKIMGGLKNLGVGLEVSSIDQDKKAIRFCYLNQGNTEGTQEIRLTETSDGYSIITQETRYRSNSKFRDKRLYPKLHSKFVNELHQNLIKMIVG